MLEQIADKMRALKGVMRRRHAALAWAETSSGSYRRPCLLSRPPRGLSLAVADGFATPRRTPRAARPRRVARRLWQPEWRRCGAHAVHRHWHINPPFTQAGS